MSIYTILMQDQVILLSITKMKQQGLCLLCI